MMNRRREIVTVADELFAAHGYQGTSIEKIATASGYSVGGIYMFFTGKEDLYAAVLQRHTDTLTERLEACTSSAHTGMDMLMAMTMTVVTTLREYPDHSRYLLATIAGERRASRSDDLKSHLKMYEAAIERGQRDGTVRAGSPVDLAQYLGGLLLAHMRVDPQIGGAQDGTSLEGFLEIVLRAFGSLGDWAAPVGLHRAEWVRAIDTLCS